MDINLTVQPVWENMVEMFWEDFTCESITNIGQIGYCFQWNPVGIVIDYNEF